MREHGSITIDPDLRTAYFRTEYPEDCARVATVAAAVPGTSKIPLVTGTDPLAGVR